jgi:hypothetical protein
LIYAVTAAAAAGRSPGSAAVLAGCALLEAGWLAASQRRIALLAGIVLNTLLVAIWVRSHASGQPVSLLDALCVGDCVALVWLAAALWRPLAAASPALSHLAILLAVASLSVLAGGHEHANAGPARGAIFYCHLL